MTRLPSDLEAEDRKATRDIGALMMKNVVTQGLSVARQLVVLPLISPGQLGLFRYVSQLVSYSSLFHFGATMAFKVRFPEWQAAGRERDCNVLQTIAWRQVLVGAALFLPLLAAFLWAQTDLSPLMIAVIAVSGMAPLLAEYSIASYTVRGRFREIAHVDVWVAIGSFVAMLVGTVFWGVHGLILGSLLGPLIRCGLAREYFRPRPKVWPSGEEFRAHFAFGGRVWVGNTLAKLGNTIDIVVLGMLLGESAAALGTYSLGVTIGQLLSQDVRAAALVHQRNLQVRIGRAGGVASADVRIATRSYASLDFYLGVVFACVALLLTAGLLPALLPHHAAAAHVVGPLACSLVVLRVKRYSLTILQQAGRNALTVFTSMVQVVLLIGGFLLLSRWSEAHVGHYALVRLGAFWIAALLETVLSHAVMGSSREGLVFAARTFLAVAPLVAGVGIAPLYVESPWTLVTLALVSFPVATASYWIALDRVPLRARDLFAGVWREKVRRLLRRARRS